MSTPSKYISQRKPSAINQFYIHLTFDSFHVNANMRGICLEFDEFPFRPRLLELVSVEHENENLIPHSFIEV